MSFFPVLDGKTLPELTEMFVSEPSSHGVDPDESDLFFEETAADIARHGNDGVAFLLDAIPKSDPKRLRGILFSFSCVEKDSIDAGLFDRLKSVLVSYLDNRDPELVAEAIDGLGHLGFADMADAVMPFLDHNSPYVVGSALRFLSRHCPECARPLLIKALASAEPIVRQNAIDELDEMECLEALPNIAGLLNDPDKHVREAAQWAVANLGPLEECVNR